jgi:hypothetical protein
VISHGPPATVGGEPPFNRNFTPGPRIHGHSSRGRPDG